MAQTNTLQKRKTFEEFLIDENWVTAKQLTDLNLEQDKTKQSLEQALVTSKLLDEEKLTRARAKFFGLPYVDLRSQSLSKQALTAMPKEAIENYHLLPFAKEGNSLRIALTDPADLQALQAL